MSHDYYKILGLELGATETDIKRSFRRLAKKHHPDHHRGKDGKAERATRLLIQAYKTLMDHSERMIHDAQLRMRRSQEERSFLTRMRHKRHDPAAQTRLMLYCLLHNMGEEAIGLYERLKGEHDGYDPQEHLEGRDAIDLLFLIAELYETQGRLLDAALVYERLYRKTDDTRHDAYYYKEVQARLRNLYFRTLPRSCEPREALRHYRRGLAIGLPRRERAFAHKKMAECYFECNDPARARRYLEKALRLAPKIKGIKKISQKLYPAEEPPLSIELSDLTHVAPRRRSACR